MDLGNVDAILISNYDNIAALPFITEYTNFKGKIYATDATVLFAKYYFKIYGF